jgi:anionic cell wall polymer biosynthesis LytR-Cps2A-Psr (LCP) family protein
MFSVPRDLYVEYEMACVAGYSGKINSYFSCVNSDDTKEAEQERLATTQKFIGDIFGLDIQYGVHVNHTVIKQAVDAVGGVDVDVQGSNGDSGVLDRNFDWRCNYKCYLVKYDNGVHHLDGEHALFLSMARGDIAPTYGLGNSNFDREKNQQKIIIALKEKAMSTGTLTNLSAVTKLIDAVGDNLRTNIQTNEIRTLMQIANEVKTSDIHTLSLIGDENNLVKSGDYYGASVVMPSAGIFDYSEIQAFVAKNLSSNPIVREAALIVVLNGTGQTGYGQTKADALTAEGYTVSLVDNAPEGVYSSVEIYQIGEGNSSTAEKLASLYDVVIKKTAPPIAVDSDVGFVIIFGDITN